MVRLPTHIWLIRPQWVNRPKTQNNTPATESPVSSCNNQVLWWTYTVGMRDLSHPVYRMGLLFVIGSRCKAMMTFTERVTIWHNKWSKKTTCTTAYHACLKYSCKYVYLNLSDLLTTKRLFFADTKNSLLWCCPDHATGLGHTRHWTSSQIDIFSLYYHASRLRTTLPYGRYRTVI